MRHAAPGPRPRIRILFDQGTPVPLRRFLSRHEVVTAHEGGWSRLKNGELLDLAETEGFDIFLTTYTNFKYQQNLDTLLEIELPGSR